MPLWLFIEKSCCTQTEVLSKYLNYNKRSASIILPPVLVTLIDKHGSGEYIFKQLFVYQQVRNSHTVNLNINNNSKLLMIIKNASYEL